ncbi:phage head-tail adapter protein [Listeria monocytogenes]|nr:phage head-tail adapter protein [Listeria monocytogenes]
MRKFKYEEPKVQSGDLRTPVTFYEYAPSNGPEPGEEEKSVLFECFAEVYNPSMKDLQILDNVDTKFAVTLTIRDPQNEYFPTNKHFLEIHDFRYNGRKWNILDVRPDMDRFITVLAGANE